MAELNLLTGALSRGDGLTEGSLIAESGEYDENRPKSITYPTLGALPLVGTYNTLTDNGIHAFTFTPDDGVPPAVAPFAHATAAGQTLYVTGQMPTDIDGSVVGDDVATQTDQVMRNLLRVTELCGGGLADVVSVRAYLIDWGDYDAFNTAYAAWFPDRLPSRTCVGVTGLAVGARVEIDWVCWRSGGWGSTIGS